MIDRFRNPRRGNGFIVVLIGMLLLSITFFSHQSRQVLNLLALQRKLLVKVRQGDRPEKMRPLASREAIPAPLVPESSASE